ncbi:MAG: RNA 2',3'-cyclic phosphodiesterase [Candidatus Aenigmatarchaeota archaeon]
MRCFVAVDVPEQLKSKISAIQNELSQFCNAGFTKPENLHFTLKFLGEIDEAEIAKVKANLEVIASRFTPIETKLKGIGAFPSPSYIRVIWLGAPGLQQLQNEVSKIGQKEEKEQIPHLTIARVKSVSNKEALSAFLEKNKNIVIGPMIVNETKLKKSTLTSSGPIYEDLHAFKLKKADD